jgi:hypothetical protein
MQKRFKVRRTHSPHLPPCRRGSRSGEGHALHTQLHAEEGQGKETDTLSTLSSMQNRFNVKRRTRSPHSSPCRRGSRSGEGHALHTQLHTEEGQGKEKDTLSTPEALKMFLLRAAQNLKLSSTQHRRTAWGVQRGRRRVQLKPGVNILPFKPSK